MMLPAQPNDFERLFMIGMVHFRFGVAADTARRPLNLPASRGLESDMSGRIANGVAIAQRMRFPPLPHVGGVAIEAVFLPDPQMCFAAAGADHDLPAVPAKQNDERSANADGGATDEKKAEQQRTYVDHGLRQLAAFERCAAGLEPRRRGRCR
jgi:hypothetical protein